MKSSNYVVSKLRTTALSLLMGGSCLLISTETVFAQTQPAAEGAAPGFSEILSKMLPMFAFVFLIFYFLVLKPQQDKLKVQKAMLESLKKGDAVVTNSGIFGRVAAIEKDFILLEVSNNVKIKLEAAAITKRVEKTNGGDKAVA